MNRDGGDVDLWDVIDTDRGGGGDGGDAGRIVCKAAAIQHVVGGETLDLAGGAIDADARVHLDRVALGAALKLLIAVMRQPDRLTRKEHRGERDVEHEGRVIAPAKT